MRSAFARRGVADPTVYPAEDHTGETEWHRAVCLLLWDLAKRFVEDRRRKAHVGSNQFVHWVQHNPGRCVAPDVYVLPNASPGPDGLDVVKT